MDRSTAYEVLTKYINNKNLLKHCLAGEAAMKAIYRELRTMNSEPISSEDEITWGITGLLHDVDYEVAQSTNQLNLHGKLLFEPDSTEKVELPKEIEHAIRAHNYHNTGTLPETPMDWAIACVDQLTGLIVACALITPDKKLERVDTDFVIKRMKQTAFARNVDRTEIGNCIEKLGIPLPKFIEITLSSMKEISDILGL